MNEPASEKVGMTAVEEFMANGYEFRKNVLSDKYEMREINGHWRVVTRESINSISRRLKREVDEEKNWRSEVEEYIHSEETPCYDPIVEYLDSLPTWDGKDRVRELFRRLPGANDEQLAWLAVWLRSAVAHWLHLDPLHGNENIVTLIGPQGCGKTTFCCQLLPPQFRSYYLDHVNLGNKFDKEMALTNNLLVNIDELDQIKPGKQADGVEEQGQWPPYLRPCPERPFSLRLVCGYDQQSPSAARPHGQSPLSLRRDPCGQHHL